MVVASLLLLGAAREDTAAFGAHLLRMLGPSAPTEHSGARDFTVGVRLGEPRRCLDKRLSSAAERYAVRAIAPFPRLDRKIVARGSEALPSALGRP